MGVLVLAWVPARRSRCPPFYLLDQVAERREGHDGVALLDSVAALTLDDCHRVGLVIRFCCGFGSVEVARCVDRKPGTDVDREMLANVEMRNLRPVLVCERCREGGHGLLLNYGEESELEEVADPSSELLATMTVRPARCGAHDLPPVDV